MKDLLFVIPLVTYVAIVIGVIALARYRRKTRWPFKLEDRLLRGPGESLLKRVREIDEEFSIEMVVGMVVALLVGSAVSLFAARTGQGEGIVLLAGLAGFLFATIISARRIHRLWTQRQSYHLGWFGERVVAEKLAPLRFTGWRVFHDVPFVNNGKPFNIDHVVLGEGGLFVIETKTRRKGGSSISDDDGVVWFDGQALDWPRYKRDQSGLRQAELNAETLVKWVRDEIGEKVDATPLLVIPGWSIKFRKGEARGRCRVESANWIKGCFENLAPSLDPQTVELIALRLLAKCRDVEE